MQIQVRIDDDVYTTKYGTLLADLLASIEFQGDVYNKHGKALPARLPIRGSLQAWRAPPSQSSHMCASQCDDDLSSPQSAG